ncbi:MAG: hypothetical protein JNL58_26805 [Planctomyces sp.]|nr:hypothetical protein [Planctomyces sp.]
MIALFVMKLAAGITLMWLLMPRKEVTDGFFRIQMRLVLGLSVLGALLLSRSGTWEAVQSDVAAEETARWLRGLQIAAAVVAYPGSIFWALGRRTPGNIAIWALALLTNSALLLHSIRIPNECHAVLQMLSDVTSAGVLGAMLTGMLLGHWYLTTPTMSIKPLWWFTKALIVVGVMRLIVSSILVATSGMPGLSLPTGLWFGLRLVCGIVIPVIVAVTVLRILKYRNTQSATGVLFAGLILIFMGEMMAALLERATRIPF